MLLFLNRTKNSPLCIFHCLLPLGAEIFLYKFPYFGLNVHGSCGAGVEIIIKNGALEPF
jgi:hypothetical protein